MENEVERRWRNGRKEALLARNEEGKEWKLDERRGRGR